MKATSPSYLKQHFLIAMPHMADPTFSQTLIYLVEHSQDGAMGLIVNRPSGLHLIEAQVAGVQTLAFLDTGSTMTIGNAALLRQATRRKGMVRDWADVQVVSVTGAALPGRLAALNQIQLGNVMLRTVPVVFGPVHTFDYWGLADQPAILIGVDVLKNFDAVAFDFSRGRVHFRLPSASAAREAAAS